MKILKLDCWPLSGEYKELGNSILYSLQLALKEIGDKRVIIVPRDLVLNDEKKLVKAVEELRSKKYKSYYWSN